MRKIGAAHTRALYNTSPYMAEFHKLMDQQCYAYHYADVYRDFLNLSICALLSDHTKDHPREKEYMGIVDKYRGDKVQMRRFADMFGCVAMHIHKTGRECLSELWEVYASNDNLGQFFTPWSVCQLLNRITDGAREIPESGNIIVSDPSCGGGRMFIASALDLKPYQRSRVFYHGIDIDYFCCVIAALNLCFFNLNGWIVHGDALSLKGHRVFECRHTVCGGMIREWTDADKVEKIITMGLPVESEITAREQPLSGKQCEQLCFNF